MAILRDTFHFHPLAIEDALEEAHAPKVNDWREYVYLVLHGVKLAHETLGGATLEHLELTSLSARTMWSRIMRSRLLWLTMSGTPATMIAAT